MVKDRLQNMLAEAVRLAREAGELPPDAAADIVLETPPSAKFGDYSTNLAMVLSSQTGKPPREAAQALMRHLPADDELLERVEVAGAGFINLYLRPRWLQESVRQPCLLGDRYGRSEKYAGKKINLEFVSANPSGPILVVNGRAAAMGDTLANLLEFAGWDVTREYYVNDALVSTQMEKLGESLEARYCQALGIDKPVPADGYHGEYLVELAQQVAAESGDSYMKMSQEERAAAFTKLTLEKMLEDQQKTLAAFNVNYDVWFRESGLYETGEVDESVRLLTERGHTYESEGALWLQSTKFGAEKDEVLVRSTGKPAYLAGDLAYHRNKFQRGFDRLIDIWGPDHHGHVARLKAGMKALGYEPETIDILIHQIVRLVSQGEQVRMSKRAGDIVPLSDLVSEVGRDAARFFFLMRSHDTPLDFDLELAKQKSLENPVYYVQYAHARICSILAEAQERGVALPGPEGVDLAVLTSDEERTLMRKLADFPEEVMGAAEACEPHRLTRYGQELGGIFHVFYTKCRVLGSEPAVQGARLTLVQATRVVLRNLLSLMGISAPERM